MTKVKLIRKFVFQIRPMFYNVKALSLEELEILYIKESQKLASALEIKISHNSVMVIKKHLEHIGCELNLKQPYTSSNMEVTQRKF